MAEFGEALRNLATDFLSGDGRLEAERMTRLAYELDVYSGLACKYESAKHQIVFTLPDTSQALPEGHTLVHPDLTAEQLRDKVKAAVVASGFTLADEHLHVGDRSLSIDTEPLKTVETNLLMGTFIHKVANELGQSVNMG